MWHTAVFQIKHQRELGLHAVSTIAVGFIHYENVSNLHQTGFHDLYAVARLWHDRHEDCISRTHHIKFCLPNSNGLDQHIITPKRIKQLGHILGGPRETTVTSRSPCCE